MSIEKPEGEDYGEEIPLVVGMTITRNSFTPPEARTPENAPFQDCMARMEGHILKVGEIRETAVEFKEDVFMHKGKPIKFDGLSIPKHFITSRYFDVIGREATAEE